MNKRADRTYCRHPGLAASMRNMPLKLRVALKAVELWLSTCRPVIIRPRCTAAYLEQRVEKPVIALWHQALIYSLYHFRVYPAAIMTSASKDGEWIARAITQWGQLPVRGSRLKGGLRAIRNMADLMSEYGVGAGIVADGSKGPPGIAQIGAIILARDTGRPIVPTGFAASSAIYFNSWDRMILPLPFSRVSLVYGTMFEVPPGSRGRQVEKYRKRLESALHEAEARARTILK